MNRTFTKMGQQLAKYLSARVEGSASVPVYRPQELIDTIQKGDVLLVEGDTRFSKAIKFISQSNWSHSAICIASTKEVEMGLAPAELIEADVQDGVRYISIREYTNMHTRICRPIGVNAEQLNLMCIYLKGRIGHQYDLKNVFDLARYLIHSPPIPTRFRRRLFELGSGDPTRAICSSLIAQAFSLINYPILPTSNPAALNCQQGDECMKEWDRIRHHSFYAPRDFDISPYFDIIKPGASRIYAVRHAQKSQAVQPDLIVGQSELEGFTVLHKSF